MNQRLEDLEFVVFDTETTGPYPGRFEFCEIAALRGRFGEDFKAMKSFEQLIKPSRLMSEKVISIHGIDNEMVADAPSIEEVLPKFIDFLSGAIPIAHHAPFDLSFVTCEMARLKMEIPEGRALCTSLLARSRIRNVTNHKLQNLIRELGLEGGRAHRALDDAKGCFQVFKKCLETWENSENLFFEDLEKAQGQELSWQSFCPPERSELEGGLLHALRESSGPWEMVYMGGSKPGKTRWVEPEGLMYDRGNWFFVAKEGGDRKRKKFFVEKIKSIYPELRQERS